MFSLRSRLSFMQFLLLQDAASLPVLLEKHGIAVLEVAGGVELNYFRRAIEGARQEQLHSLLDEVVRTHRDLRNHVAPRYRFDERWQDLQLCLRLDGYVLDHNGLVPVDPAIDAAPPVEDDLSRELRQSALPEAEDIITSIGNSADAFRRNPPDYNACMTNARVTLQTLARSIARVWRQNHPGNFDEASWGGVLAYLRNSGFVTPEEEAGLAGIFRFVSPGAHRPVGLSEQEVARVGLSEVASMCYFLVKQYTGQRA
jgi:hypothetical protein